MKPFLLPDGRWINPHAVHNMQLYLDWGAECPHFKVLSRDAAGLFRFDYTTKEEAEDAYASTVEAWKEAC